MFCALYHSGEFSVTSEYKLESDFETKSGRNDSMDFYKKPIPYCINFQSKVRILSVSMYPLVPIQKNSSFYFSLNYIAFD